MRGCASPGKSTFTISRLTPIATAVCWLVTATPVGAQSGAVPSTPSPEPPAPAWSVYASAAVYVLPDDDNYLQPTVSADRGALHLEARYNYEDLASVSGFVGWNFPFGEALTLQLTPMFGAVAGETSGLVPALEMELGWKRFELSSESEYVIDLDDHRDSFLYNWSEASVWIADSFRAGVCVQRTRAYDSPRDVQRGFLLGTAFSKIDATAYLFNPGADDYVLVVSFGVTF